KFEEVKGRGYKESNQDFEDANKEAQLGHLYAAQTDIQKVIDNPFTTTEVRGKASKIKGDLDAKIKEYEDVMERIKKPFGNVQEEHAAKKAVLNKWGRMDGFKAG